jgi:exodeoxyribonuclease VII large subunit
LAEVIIAPCKVQGAGAADSVVEALYTLYEANVDVIIVARGGGSAEDLWTFNEESVARAVFASPVPLVSGVGHETDTTMIDYVADLRAPTPSAAAELVTPDRTEMSEVLEYLRERLDLAIDTRFATFRNDLDRSRRRLELRSPLARIGRDRQFLDETLRRAEVRIGHRILLERARLDGMQARLMALSPKATLERGYAVVRKLDGHVVTQPEHVNGGEGVIVTVRGGDIPMRVE